MKQALRNFLQKAGLMVHLDVFREKFFPTAYYRQSILDQERYVKFYEQFISKGDLCFDIGAHKGHRTSVFLKSGAKVIAVEPQRDCYKYLQLKYGKMATILNCGVGDKEGVQEMFINSSSSLSTFSKDWVKEAVEGRFSDTKWVAKSMVEIKTLDALIKQYGVPTFCKIDVESYEYEVLKGLSGKIPYLSFEFMLPENLEITKKCIDQLFKIYPGTELNYSSGDNLHLDMQEWMGIQDREKFFQQKIFQEPSWGDIYARMK